MVVRLIRYFRGYVKIKIIGYAPERFLNLCASRHIIIWNLERQGEEYTCCMTLQGFLQLRKITRKTKTTIHIQEKHGFFSFMRFLNKRKFFFIGIATSFILFIVLSFFIWDIDISGNISHTDEELLAFLQEQKVAVGVTKHSLDGEEIVRLIRTNYPDIVWVSTQIKGTRLFIDLRESETSGQEILNNEEASDLVAEQAGTITSMITRQGKPLVKEGDTVEAGQLLVQGRLEILNDSGEVTAYQYCHADADIDLKSTMPYSETIPLAYEKKVFTEKERKHFILTLFGKEICLGRKIPYEHYESKAQYYPLKLGKNFYLPVGFTIETFQEFRLEEAEYEKKEALLLAKDHLDFFCKNLKEKGVQIIENNVKIECNGINCISSGNLVILNRVQQRQQTEVIEMEIPKEEP